MSCPCTNLNLHERSLSICHAAVEKIKDWKPKRPSKPHFTYSWEQEPVEHSPSEYLFRTDDYPVAGQDGDGDQGVSELAG